MGSGGAAWSPPTIEPAKGGGEMAVLLFVTAFVVLLVGLVGLVAGHGPGR